MYVQSKRYYKFEVKPVLNTDAELTFSTNGAEGYVFMEDTPIEDVLFNDEDTAVNYLENFLELFETLYSYGEEVEDRWSTPKLEKIGDRKWIVGRFEFVVTLVCPNIKVV